MGMYTGLRCRVKVKPEYQSVIDTLNNSECLENTEEEYNWIAVTDDSEKYKFIRDWASKFDRSNFIPYGTVCYMDESWDDNGFSRYDSKTGVWEFECSLKNYNSEIEHFLKYVLSELVEEIYLCESQYEECDEPTRYKTIDDLKNVYIWQD